MATINIIVHEACVDNTLAIGQKAVQREIGKMKKGVKGRDWFSVDRSPSDLPEGLPSPSDDLAVRVCGAFYGGEKLPGCVGTQLNALRENGYRAEVYEPATIKSSNVFY